MKNITVATWGGVGAFVAIFFLTLLNQLNNEIYWLMPPFGATAVLVFGVPNSPLAQPKNVLLGHMITAIVGLTFVSFGLNEPVMMALATGLGVFFMLLSDTTHPPAGANPLLIILTNQDWVFLISPVIIGASAIILIGFCFNTVRKNYSFNVIRRLFFAMNTNKGEL
ncbi:HPP family protein [Thalassotalea ganghwensis]